MYAINLSTADKKHLAKSGAGEIPGVHKFMKTGRRRMGGLMISDQEESHVTAETDT
ncbi:MAG: hypothetical protein LIP16_15910 [Clostridium sp.]|nr:hypothetical protein [Clostridium sp.]